MHTTDSSYPWMYDGIFLGYQNTMHNIRYWDVCTGTMKVAKHDSKDETQYRDDIENRSQASMHLMEVFAGSTDHTTNTQPEKLDLKLPDQSSPSPNDILNDLLQHSSLPYTAIVVGAAKVTVPRNQQQHINRLCNRINKIKPAF